MINKNLIDLVDVLKTLPKENEWVEFKSGSATTNERVGQYISAIPNEAWILNQPFVYLVFDIDDNTHNVIGTSFRFKKTTEGNEEMVQLV